MVDRKNSLTGRSVWFQWTLYSTSGFLVITILINLLYRNLDEFLTGTALIVFQVLSLLTLGAGTAASQWLVLCRYVSGLAKWILASSAGLLFGAILALPLKLQDWYMGPSGFQLDEIAYGAVLGFLMGGIQWLVVRTWTPRASWWIVGSVIGRILGMTVGECIPLNWEASYTNILYGTITEGIPIMLTGLVLVYLLPSRTHTGATVG